eukprot:TRINITY_DN92115_c0_g1_i1.p1 TRINITY_DN92115_c0_g1~~TRINITY_DN92115_c0_g1_i1.p1  ORF type:complete len:657 (-),score=126.19 TRINITY_DN92115_c0_g1_i1:41-2011(-)
MAENGSASASILQAAVRICGRAQLSEELQVISKVFAREGLVDLDAGAEVSVVRACRAALEEGKPRVNHRDLEIALCEVISALWADDAYRRAWGEAKEKKSQSFFDSASPPLSRVLSGARSFSEYGDAESNRKYFKNFGRLVTQATMLQDETRTGTYQKAIHANRGDFEGRVVMDVGSGSGMLAFFALQAGAARVYCIEASPMADVIRELANANGWSDRVVVVNKILQDIRDEVPEKVDCILHETLGTCLFAERGIETVCVARDRFLKPGGRLFPAFVTFCLAPFEDKRMHQAVAVRALNLWTSTDFHGVDVSRMAARARQEHFSRPLCDQFHPDQLRADPCLEVFDFRTLRPEQVRDFDVKLNFRCKDTCVLHGLATWFEAHFEGSACNVVLSTSPWDTLTHWWQSRLLLMEPLAVNDGQALTGKLSFEACEGNTYMCKLVLETAGSRREQGGYDLADIDTSNRAPQHKTVQVSPVQKVQVIDWAATKAAPSSAKALVEDPMRQTKAAATASMQRVAAGPSGTTCPAGGGSRTGSSNGGREYGSQIQVDNQVFMLVDDPKHCKSLTQAGVQLEFVGSLGGSLLMAPLRAAPQQPRTCLLEMAADGASMVQPRCWLEHASGVEHMRDYVLQVEGSAALGTQISLPDLIARYKAAKRS